jgi:inhibitor of KinA
MKLEPLGDSAVVATLGSAIAPSTPAAVLGLAGALAAARGAGIVDIVPAYATVTVFYDPLQFDAAAGPPFESVCRWVTSCAGTGTAAPAAPARSIEIPVCYGGDFGPDLGVVAGRSGLAPEQAAELHGGADYLVHAIGFTPGFPFLGGLPEPLHTPRRPTPRARVPAGSVGIGGAQTGVYPVPSPGGWQLIGRTPLALFRPAENPAALLKPGDRVRFRPITRSEFDSWR